MTVRYYPSVRSNDPIAEQTTGTYEDYKKIKGFEDVGHFLIAYVVDGGAVTKNVTMNNQVDVSNIVVTLNNDVMARDGVSFPTTIADTTYYLDFTLNGDFSWATAHPTGVVGTDYLTIATVTTDSNKNVNVITDTRGPIGGFRLKSNYGLEGFATTVQLDNLAGAGRTTETVKGNSDALAAHLADTTVHVNNLTANSKSNSDGLSAFSVGLSIMTSTQVALGFPSTFGVLTTFKTSSYAQQTFIQAGSERTWTRSWNDGTSAWSNWGESSASSEEMDTWKDKAALLDPNAYEYYTGSTFDVTVPVGETWYAVNMWHVQTGSTFIFQRVLDINRAVILPAGTQIKANGTQSGSAIICKPSLVISNSRYNNPKQLYYERLNRLKSMVQYDLSVTIAAGSARGTTQSANFPVDFDTGLIVLYSIHDVSWLTLSGSITVNTLNEVSDDHQQRLAEGVIFPFKRSTFSSITVRAASISGNTTDTSLAGEGAIKYFKLPADW